MTYIHYDKNSNDAQSREVSRVAQGQQNHHRAMPRPSSALLPRLRRFGCPQRPLLVRLSKFLLVGGTGVFVNSLALLILFQWVHLPLLLASALAVELAITNNFCWNDRWTFRRTGISLRRFIRFNLVSLGGLIITTMTLWLLVGHLGIYYLIANLLGIALATVWNFSASSWWTWGGTR